RVRPGEHAAILRQRPVPPVNEERDGVRIPPQAMVEVSAARPLRLLAGAAAEPGLARRGPLPRRPGVPPRTGRLHGRPGGAASRGRLVPALGLHAVRADDRLPRWDRRTVGAGRTDVADDGDGPR